MTRNVPLISLNELQEAIDQDFSGSEIKASGQLFLNAVNDWPMHNFININDFISALHHELGSTLTLERIIEYSKKLYSGNQAWKLEAMSSLIEIFNNDNAKSLESIVFEIIDYYKLLQT